MPSIPSKANSGVMIIESIGVYLPAVALSTDDVLRGCKKELRFPLERLSGIRSRRVVGSDEFAIDLAKKAIADCLARSNYGPRDIDLLISCNISKSDGPGVRFSVEPSTSVRLRR